MLLGGAARRGRAGGGGAAGAPGRRAGRGARAGAAGQMEIAFGPAVIRVGADVDAAALRRVLEVVRSLA